MHLYKMSKFSSNLRKLMARAELTQVDLAKLSGIKQQAISRYLNEDPQGKRPRDLEALVALCLALNCSLYDLTGLRSLREIQTSAPDSQGLSDEAIRLARLFDKLSSKDPKRARIKKALGMK